MPVCICVYMYLYSYMCVYEAPAKLKNVIICVISSEKMQNHHHMPDYQPLHHYEHFNVSLCQTVRWQFQSRLLLPLAHMTPSYPHYSCRGDCKYDSQISLTPYLVQGCVCVMKFRGESDGMNITSAHAERIDIPFHVWIMQWQCQGSR
jgi:hypothetical protein